MKYVYILQSIEASDKFYVGSTNNLKERLAQHNAGHSAHTRKHKPWKVKTYIAFNSDDKAADFEKFLKTGSGRAFAKKRL